MKINEKNTELLIQFQKKSNYYIAALCMLFLFFCVNTINKEYSYLLDEGKLGGYSNSQISPIINAMLLFFLLFSSTLFTFYGYFMARYDNQASCISLRKLSFDLNKIIHSQYFFFSIFLFLFLFLDLIVGIITSSVLEGSNYDFASLFCISSFRLLIQKILCISMVSFISFTTGRIISYCTKKTIIGLILCLVVDQILIPKWWLTTAFIYRVFSDNEFYVSVSTYNLKNVNKIIIYVVVFVLMVVIYKIMQNLAFFRYSHEE